MSHKRVMSPFTDLDPFSRIPEGFYKIINLYLCRNDKIYVKWIMKIQSKIQLVAKIGCGKNEREKLVDYLQGRKHPSKWILAAPEIFEPESKSASTRSARRMRISAQTHPCPAGMWLGQEDMEDTILVMRAMEMEDCRPGLPFEMVSGTMRTGVFDIGIAFVAHVLTLAKIRSL